jgi:hypothetical protein
MPLRICLLHLPVAPKMSPRPQRLTTTEEDTKLTVARTENGDDGDVRDLTMSACLPIRVSTVSADMTVISSAMRKVVPVVARAFFRMVARQRSLSSSWLSFVSNSAPSAVRKSMALRFDVRYALDCHS